MPRSSRQLDHMKTWRLQRDANCSGMDMSPILQVWPKLSCKAQWKGEEDKAHRRKVGRQHQGMDRPGVRQVPEGSGKQGKMKKTGCKIICGALTTLAVKRLMMMMMIMMMMNVQVCQNFTVVILDIMNMKIVKLFTGFAGWSEFNCFCCVWIAAVGYFWIAVASCMVWLVWCMTSALTSMTVSSLEL